MLSQQPTPADLWLSTRLLMRRPALDDLPALPDLPAGFSLRTYEPDDCLPLAKLLSRAFDEPWDEALVRVRLADAPDVAAIYLVVHERHLAATASARMGTDEFPDAGYVHWVGADPDYQRRGLGRLVTLRVLHHFRAAGLQSAVLETQVPRLAAQRTYLKLGFVPEYRDREEQVRWSRLLPQHLRQGDSHDR
ncbi:MAG TPA: GNAT family N-acetyltransferase [Chloroflexota bacterium]|nr:GNAT family N-acetyltransferase [Chloroflexota bacterium]